jgi:hypothetical protein
MQMAKLQKATLDPSKVSGRCGRLKCCLRYEHETYESLVKKLPRIGSYIATHETVGRVIERQIMTQLVKIVDEQGRFTVVPVEAIVERNVKPGARRDAQKIPETKSKQTAPTPNASREDRTEAPATPQANGLDEATEGEPPQQTNAADTQAADSENLPSTQADPEGPSPETDTTTPRKKRRGRPNRRKRSRRPRR